jgi:hypothetical protein
MKTIDRQKKLVGTRREVTLCFLRTVITSVAAAGRVNAKTIDDRVQHIVCEDDGVMSRGVLCNKV